MATGLSIRALTADDAASVLAIFRQGIETGHATFQAEAPDWPAWDAGHHAACRLIAQDAAQVLGWAALAPVSARRVYAGVAEVSVYVAGAARRRGVGGLLLEALIDAADAAGIWTLQAGIFPENAASIRLHEAHGFHVVGTREKLGLMTYGPLAGRWRDVVLLERRRRITGTHDLIRG